MAWVLNDQAHWIAYSNSSVVRILLYQKLGISCFAPTNSTSSALRSSLMPCGHIRSCSSAESCSTILFMFRPGIVERTKRTRVLRNRTDCLSLKDWRLILLPIQECSVNDAHSEERRPCSKLRHPQLTPG